MRQHAPGHLFSFFLYSGLLLRRCISGLNPETTDQQLWECCEGLGATVESITCTLSQYAQHLFSFSHPTHLTGIV